MKLSRVLESFVSNLTNLTKAEVQRAFHDNGDTKVVILATFFTKLIKGSDAEYLIVTKDEDTGEFIVNRARLASYLGHGLKVEHIEPIPEKEFSSLEQAKSYAAHQANAT